MTREAKMFSVWLRIFAGYTSYPDLLPQSLAGWQVTVGVVVNLINSPDTVITELRLAAGGESGGLGVRCAPLWSLVVWV